MIADKMACEFVLLGVVKGLTGADRGLLEQVSTGIIAVIVVLSFL